MADDDDQPPTLPGFEHLRPVAVVKDDATAPRATSAGIGRTYRAPGRRSPRRRGGAGRSRTLADRGRLANRLTDRDRNGIVRAAVMMGTFVGHDHPADDWAPWRRATVRNVHTIGTTAHLRPSEWAWIDAVGGAAFLAAKLDAAGGEHHG